MTSKQEIKTAFTTELMNTPQYQIILNIKQLILDEIARPNIQRSVVYNFDSPQSQDDREIIKLCLMLEFGFSTENMNENLIVIDMIQFLN